MKGFHVPLDVASRKTIALLIKMEKISWHELFALSFLLLPASNGERMPGDALIQTL